MKPKADPSMIISQPRIAVVHQDQIQISLLPDGVLLLTQKDSGGDGEGTVYVNGPSNLDELIRCLSAVRKDMAEGVAGYWVDVPEAQS
ncbi:hypothetical protein IC608_09120 [Devosia sp. PTR5]|uniref:Uncharacterized protein n=1 Tax=Devosia oryzisoli TaxID=2774138 RepID=A0A927FTB9_9HYPH|nr:hypothetical protein [Devosia oryzisoli]MBD8065636.1 hypothetical protein [Devosia oryzisoli]